MAAYRLQQAGGKWSPEKVWENTGCRLYMSTPVHTGGRLIALANVKKGQLFCIAATSGKTLWTSDGRMGDYAAMLVAGGVVLAQTDHGELLVIDPCAERFATLARYKVSEQATWAHPAMVGKNILIKDQTSLALWTMEE